MKNALRYILIFLCSISPKLYGQDINSIGPIVLPASGQTTYTVSNGQTVNITSGQSVLLGPGVTLSSGSIVNIKINIPVTPPLTGLAGLNWVQITSYDENGVEISSSRQYSDLTGTAVQVQTKNETTNQIMAAQQLYDLRGRNIGTTLSAPINSSQFNYKDGFVTAGGTDYSYLNFDGNPSNPNAKLNNPDAVDNSTIGTLGWYYSNNNTLEPMVATTGFPYSRTDFYDDGSGAAKRTSGIGETLKMGSGHEVSSNTSAAGGELANYYSLRPYFSTYVGANSSPITNAMVTISTDENGVTSMAVTDQSGNALITGRADPAGWLTATSSFNITNVKQVYQFTAVDQIGSAIDNLSITSRDTVNVYCPTCAVDPNSLCPTCPIYRGIGNNYSYTPSANDNNTYVITSAVPFSVTEKIVHVGSDDITLYDQAAPQFREPAGSSIRYFQLTNPSVVTTSGGAYSLYNMTTGLDISSSFTSGNTLPAGYYKIVAAPSTIDYRDNQVTVTYTNKYSDLAYNYYNQAGQLVANIAPNGVKGLIDGSIVVPSGNIPPFTTLYQYDLQGHLVARTSPDGGTSNYIYRQDGKIRFSQNAYQANVANSGAGNERFSYTNYDNIGRPIESGEYTTTEGTFASLATNPTVLEATDINGGLSIATKQDWIKTHYDQLDNSHGISNYVQDVGFLKGAVSWTENVNAKTWYNYDDHGRVTWIIKQITGLGNKTIDYTYNDQGNVIRVDYQKLNPTDRFIHYYAYDADGRLINVQTSRDDITKVQQAKYNYYLHGPLKRTELGDQLQGIDYVYTPQGWLKSINTPTGDATKDPNKDGVSNSFAKDAFGVQLEYFPGDYNRAGSNINSINTGQQTYYNGNVNGLSWQSNKPSSVLSLPGSAGIQNPAMYSYGFDSKYQLAAATYGAPNFGSLSFTPDANAIFNEKNISYDANGNISGLQRTNNAGALSDDFSSYQYQAGTNKLTSVGNAAAPAAYASYTYDELGRLKSEQKNQITAGNFNIKYDVTGKITGVYDTNSTLLVGYSYDENGNRISHTDNTGTTYYVYDPSGNVMALYKGTSLTEVPVYGADRLGTYTITGNNYVYELKDNVGSVRVVINRTRNGSGQADIIQYNDYYPFGKLAQNGGASGYRYEYQGAYAEKDAVTGWNNFDLRMYDGAIGRWLSVDPVGQYASPYEGMGNNPVIGIDPTGGENEWHWNGADLVADKGDNAITLATFLNTSPENAISMFQNLGNWDNGGSMNSGISGVEGHALTGMNMWPYMPQQPQGTIQAYTPGAFERVENWLNSFKTKDAPIGEGVSFWANLGIRGQGSDNRYLPNALHGVNYLGNMTPFFNYAGQVDPNEQFFEINVVNSINNLNSAWENMTHGGGYNTYRIDSANKWAKYPAVLYIDSIKSDTITEDVMFQRNNSSFTPINNPSVKY